MKHIDKFRGCPIGAAAGDASGYAVEFLEDLSIFEKFDKQVITQYLLLNGMTEISDDTQTALAFKSKKTDSLRGICERTGLK